MYSFNLENLVPSGGLAYLIAKATIDESNKWHRRLGHVNFKNLNKLVKGNLVRGLPSKIFQNDHTCVACQKGKQHEASCKVKSMSSISQPLQLLQNGLQKILLIAVFRKKKLNRTGTTLFCQYGFLILPTAKSQQQRMKMKHSVRSTASPFGGLSFTDLTNPDQDDSEIPALEEIYANPTDGIFTNSSYDDEGSVVDFTNLEPVVNVSPIPTSRINSTYPSTLILRDPQSAEELLHSDQKVWILVDLPYGKKEIGTKWVYRNKKDERGVVVRNKARIEALGSFEPLPLTRILCLSKWMLKKCFPDKYVAEILKKFDFVSVKIASTPIETQKPLVKDEEASDVDVSGHSKDLPSKAVNRIFRYLEGQTKLGLCILDVPYLTWKPIQIVIMLEQILTGNPQQEVVNFLAGDLFLGNAKSKPSGYSTIKAEYVAAAKLLWSKNPVYHSKTKHIEIRHHFILDAYEKKLIQVLKIHTDDNVADLLTKAFDVSSSIHNALTVSPVVSTTFVEQFWMSTKSKIINNVSQMNIPVPRPFFLFNALTKDEGEQSERPSEPQPAPSPPHLSEVHVEPQSDPSPRPLPTTHIPDSIPEDSGGNHGGQSSSDKSLSGNEGDMTLQSVYDLCISLCTQVTDQAKEIKHLKAQIKKLKKRAKPVITHHRAWMKSVSLKQRLAGKKSLKKNWMQKESVSKQGRKSAKAEPSVHKDPLFDELADDTLDYMDTENAQDVGRTRNVVYEEKESVEDAVSTEDVVSTDKEKVNSTDKEKDSSDRLDEGTVDQTEGRSATPTTATPTPTIFGDDETIAQVLLNMSQAKAVSKEKEKGVELKDIEETERPRPTSTKSLLTLKPLPKIDPKDKGKKKIEEEDKSDTESKGIPEAKKKFKQLAHDKEIARKMQEDWETEEERKRLAEEKATNAALIQDFDYIKARMEADRLLALRLQEEERESTSLWKREQNSFMIQLQLKEDLKNKTFDEIQALYEKVKRFDESFTAVGSTEDERKIKEMNEGAKDLKQKRLKKKVAKETPKKEDTAKVLAKVDVTEQGTKKRKGGHVKMIARKRKRPQQDVDSNDEHKECLKIVTFEGTLDSDIMEKKLVIVRINKVSSLDGDYLVIYIANGNFRAFNYLLEGNLKKTMESLTEENDQIIHMLVERRYPLSKDLLQRMLDLGLEVERESIAALDLIRFIKQQIDEE
ncbi:ribonuclease H-like domain-containing protein [Tanacetum coccineum]